MSGLMIEDKAFLPLRDVVFQTLRSAILKGELVPGQRLMEIQLADQMGVSRTPVREAIRKLELEGLVTMIPRKGAEVAHISGKNLREVLEVRQALEELAGELACLRMTEDGFLQLEKANQRFVSVISHQDIAVIAEADEEFHSVIYKATNNDKLVQMVSDLKEQMYRYRIEHIKDEKHRMILVEEHKGIIEALRKRDVEATRKAIRMHITMQETAVMKKIREQERNDI